MRSTRPTNTLLVHVRLQHVPLIDEAGDVPATIPRLARGYVSV